MYFDLRRLTEDEQTLEAAAREYEERGIFVLTGLEELVTPKFRPILCDAIGVDDSELSRILDPDTGGRLFEPEVRRRLARCETTSELTESLLSALNPLLTRLIGPLVQISSTFHAQFKGGQASSVNHGGYGREPQYMEVHGAYLLHQDFTGATIPTSPSGLTMWVGQNDCPNWSMRFYPRSHRQGLICNQWLDLDDPRVEPLGQPIDLPARAGTATIFNALMLHGTSNPGPKFRVSCDIRFFPVCGFLPTEVHTLSDDPLAVIEAGLDRAFGDTLRAPLLEDLVFLGRDVQLSEVPPHSRLNWVKYIQHVTRGELDAALPLLERFANTDLRIDSPDAYAAKFHGQPLHRERLRALASQPWARTLAAV